MPDLGGSVFGFTVPGLLARDLYHYVCCVLESRCCWKGEVGLEQGKGWKLL